MSAQWADARRVFADATAWFVRTTAQVGGSWSLPALGDWDVRSLVGHTSRALLTVETYLSRPAGEIAVGSPAAYFQVALAGTPEPEVAERGRAAGIALGADPAAAVADIADRVIPLLADRTGTEVITTLVGGMRLVDYLPTRTFELVVHTADLASALGLPLDPPGPAARQALDLIAELAVVGGSAGPLLLAATGRPGLPAGYSVL